MSRPRLTISTFGDITVRVTPDSSFEDLATYWLEDIDMKKSNLEDDPESVRAQYAYARAPGVSQSHAA